MLSPKEIAALFRGHRLCKIIRISCWASKEVVWSGINFSLRLGRYKKIGILELEVQLRHNLLMIAFLKALIQFKVQSQHPEDSFLDLVNLTKAQLLG